jgi:hypothetical protein
MLADNIGLHSPPRAGGPVADAIGFRRQLAFHGVFSLPYDKKLACFLAMPKARGMPGDDSS